MNKVFPTRSFYKFSEIDKWGVEWKINKYGFRTTEFDSIDYTQPIVLSFGCSHTMGEGIQQYECWSEILKDKINILQTLNLGQNGCSADYIARILPVAIDAFLPSIIFILWPDWTRFEYVESGNYRQSLPTDKNRIKFMEMATTEWLLNNFYNKVESVHSLCKEKNIRLIDITMYDLNTILDQPNRWPKALDNMHYAQGWHNRVSNIFYHSLLKNLVYKLKHE